MADLTTMLRLYNTYAIDIYLIVMHGDHIVERRRFIDGFPDTPIKCSCGEEINSDDLRYDFEEQPITSWV